MIYFDQIFNFWLKFRFSQIFVENSDFTNFFIFSQKFQFLTRISILFKIQISPQNIFFVDQHSDLWTFLEPFVAIVVDPVRTMSSGKINIGAFRAYPNGYKPPDDQPNEYQSIPLGKIEDFGVHCKQYYQLETSYFKSETDRLLLKSLWNKYWSSTIATSTLVKYVPKFQIKNSKI